MKPLVTVTPASTQNMFYAACITTVLVWLIEEFGKIKVPTAVAQAFTGIGTLLVGHFTVDIPSPVVVKEVVEEAVEQATEKAETRSKGKLMSAMILLFTAAVWTYVIGFSGKVLGAGTLSISIPSCNNMAITSATGTTIVLNCSSSPTPPTPPTPTPPTPGVISCTGFSNTVVTDLNWQNPTRQYSPMGINTAVVVRFTTGSVSSTTSLPRIAGAEYNSSPSSRLARLSATPCDFSTGTPAGVNIGPTNSVTAQFAISPGSGYNFYGILNPNTTYYLNVKNSSNDVTCAGSGICDLFFDLIKPGGM